MPNIFDGLRKISDDDIIEQIALLETMNLTNISKPIVQKAKKKTVSIINFFGSKIGKNNIIEEPEVKEIWTLVDEKKEELKICTRTELDERLVCVLKEKSKNNIENPTEDEISIEIIEEAAKLYKFYKSSTPAQKADNIYLKYCEKLNGKAKEQQLLELKETTEIVEETLRNMGEEKRKDFEQSVDVENLTLLNAWRNVDRQLLVKLVWLSVKAYGGRFTPEIEILPSFMEKEKEEEIIKQEEDLNQSQEKLLELKNKIETCKEKINSIEKSLEEKSSLLNNAIKNKAQAEDDVKKLDRMNVKLEKVKKLHDDKLEELKEQIENATLEKLDLLMEEFKKVKFDTIDINNEISDITMNITYKNKLIEDSIKEIISNEKTIQEIGSEVQKFKLEGNNLIQAYNQKKEDVHKREEFKKNEIFDRWSKFFYKFTFEFNNICKVVKFSRDELLHIEECLYELHFTKDPMALSNGIITDEDNKKEEYSYIDIRFADKFKVELQYKMLNNEEKNIHIVEITTEF